MSSRPLDIFDVLKNVSRKEYWTYNGWSAEQRQAFAPVVVMKWMKSTPSDVHAIRLNDMVNRYMFGLSKHKELQFKLLCATNPDTRVHRYKWIPKSAKESTKPLTTKLLQDAYGISRREVKLYLKTMTVDDVVYLAGDLGYQDTDITKIRNEFK